MTGIDAGKLVYQVQADMTELRKQLNQVEALTKKTQKQASSFSDTISGISPVAIGAAGGLLLLAAGMKKSITAASDLEEQTAKFNTVFGEQKNIAEDWANTLVQSYAMSTREAKQNLAAMMDLLEPMGMNAEKAAAMSFEVTKLSADLGSFNNLPTAQVMGDIQSALVGNFETMKKYGVVLNETVTKEEARRLGIIKGKEELTATQKAEVAYQLILKGSKNAIGDMSRTSDSYANSSKKLTATIENFAATMGGQFLPAISTGTNALGSFIKYLNDSIVALNSLGGKVTDFIPIIGGLSNTMRGIENQRKQEYEHEITRTAGRIRLLEEKMRYDQGYQAYLERFNKQNAQSARVYTQAEKDAWAKAYQARSDMNTSLTQKIYEQNGMRKAALAVEYSNAIEGAKKVGADRYKVDELYAAKFKALQDEMAAAQKTSILSIATEAISFAQSSVSQLSSIFQQYATNQSMALDNEQTKRQTAIEEWYAEQEDQINNSVLTEKQRTKKLEALDEERARREQALNDDIDKKKRKIEYEAAKRAKVINITQSIMNTALGITNALARSGPPWVGIAMAAVIGALGAAQTAMIAAQPLPELAEGGVVQATRGGVPVITGEGGSNELVAPLTPEVYENLAQNIVAAQGASSASASTLHVIFESGGIAVGEYVMKGTKNGTIKIDMRSLVKN